MFNVTPGSAETMLRTDKEGIISTLLEAGCLICAPSCSMCPGFYTPLAKNEVCIASSTTNVPGRMGEESAQVYLGSPPLSPPPRSKVKSLTPANIFKE